MTNLNHGAGFDSVETNQANLTPEQLNNLTKALEAGQLQGGDMNGGQTNGGALKTESLDAALTLLQFKESDIRFWKKIPQAKAYSTVEEFNQLTSYGSDRGGFNLEGELPQEEDSAYTRKAEHVKYLGVTKSVTHQMELVETNIGSIMERETTNGILWILRKADRALFYGDSKVIPQEWNGLYAQHMNNDKYSTLGDYLDSEHVIDLRGRTLAEEDLEKGSTTMLNNYAQADTLIAPPVVLSDYAKLFYARQRVALGGQSNPNISNITTGNHISSFQSQYGLINFEYDIFATKKAWRKSTSPATSPKAPTAPTAVGVTVNTADGESKFADGVGDYYYAVSAVNRFGESAMVQVDGTVTVANIDDSVDLEFTATAGAYQPTAFIIYRSKKNPTVPFVKAEMSPILTVPKVGNDTKRGSLANGVDGAAAGKVRDRNRFLTGVQEAMLMEVNSEIIEFKKLAPLMKMDLALLSPAKRFMVLLYGTPIIKAPTKMVRYINIGKA